MKDDCLKINCTVGVVVSATDCPRLHSIRVPESDIGAHFGVLLENMEASDITFDVAGQKFRAHKLVLAARSPLFRSEFFDGLEEDKQEIAVTDLEPKVFKVKKRKKKKGKKYIYNCCFISVSVCVSVEAWVSTCALVVVFYSSLLLVMVCPIGHAAFYIQRFPYRRSGVCVVKLVLYVPGIRHVDG